MPTRYVHPEEGWNQNLQRQLTVFFDQHRVPGRFPDGRPWWCYTENPADPKHPRHPVGELIPVTADLHIEGLEIRGWDAPWTPEPKYVKPSAGTMSGNRFKIDYQRMIADYKAANVTYYTKAAREAAERNWPGPRLYGPVSFQLRAVVGNPPKSPKVPEAALAGDPWLLGFSPTPNDALARILADERDQLAVTLIEAGLDEIPAEQKVRAGQGHAAVLGTSTAGTLLSAEEIEVAIRAAENLKRGKLRAARMRERKAAHAEHAERAELAEATATTEG